MIIVLRKGATDEDVSDVTSKIEEMGLKTHVSKGVEYTVIGALGDESKLQEGTLRAMRIVEKVMPIMKPYKLVSREFQEEDTLIDVGGVQIGGKQLVLIAGPCSVESREQLLKTAKAVKDAGATLLRGGAFKPRTSPYSFQGMGEDGLKLLAEAREKTGLPVVTEVMDTAQVELVAEYADVLQVGARNMQNFPLLKKLGALDKPILLKRGLAATLDEFLMSAEYLLSGGNKKVILCERGIRTFCSYTRNTLDLNIIPAIKKLTHLPIIVDPSHGTGRYDLVATMCGAAIAAGADGLSVEVHCNPEEAVSDGYQSLTPKNFKKAVECTDKIAKALGRSL